MSKFLSTLSIFIASSVITTCFSLPALAEDWAWQLSAGQLMQDYHEVDGSRLTDDGVLNRETGSMPMVTLSVVNTLDPMMLAGRAWLPYGKFSIAYASGETDYEGYLQSGNALTPYQTTTDNKILQADFDLGLSYLVNPSLTLTPKVSVSHHRWERSLEQYTEDFEHTALLAGADVNWQPDITLPISLQLDGKVGKIVDSNIDVPQLGLKQPIGHASIYQVGVSGQYQLTDSMSLDAKVSQQVWDYEQSEIENGYQYPDSENEQVKWELGLSYYY